MPTEKPWVGEDAIRAATEATIQQFITDNLTPDRGYSLPAEHIRQLLTDATAEINRLTAELKQARADLNPKQTGELTL